MSTETGPLCDTCHSAPAKLESDAGPWMWCSEECAKKFFRAQNHMQIAAAGEDNGETEDVTKFNKLKIKLTKKRGTLEDARTEFDTVFPVGNYPYKVMGYNRAKQKLLFLNKDRSVAVASLFSHQRLNRDFRGPWTGMRGGIIKAPTGAGKTATVHSILANYSRELVQQRTPAKFYFKEPADRKVPVPDVNWNSRAATVPMMKKELELRGFNAKVIKDLTKSDLSARLWQSQDDHVHHILIYVTKTELVADVRKDFWAQKDRSQAAYTQLMKDNNIKYSNRFAPFRQDVHVMSYKQFDNMLRGKNSAGRNFWAGFDIAHGAKFEQVSLDLQGAPIPSEIVVPVAYWQGENGWQRGNRTHAIEAMLSGTLKLVVEFTAFTSFYKEQLDELSRKLLDDIGVAAPTDKAFKRGKHVIQGLQAIPATLASSGSRGRTSYRVQMIVEVDQWLNNNVPSADVWVDFVRATNSKLIATVRQYLTRQKLGRIERPSVEPLIPASSVDAGVGWKLNNIGTVDKPVYQWQRADGDYDYNPVDRLVVAFDEADLMFNPEKLLAQESADADMIVSALQQSEGAVAFFTSATIDMLDGLKMASALTEEKDLKTSKIPKFDKDEEDVMSLLGEVERNQVAIANELRGKIGVTTVKGMRDLFPEQEYLDPLYYDISKEHVESVKKALPLTVKSLMNAINFNTSFSEAYDISLDSYDPDRTLKELLPRNVAFGHGPQDIIGTNFPLGRVLLEQLRRADDDEVGRFGANSLTGRGIVTSSPNDNTVRIVAAILQAVGYQWHYLVEKSQDWTQRDNLNKAKSRGEAPLDEWRSVKWTERPYDTHATDLTLQSLGLDDFKAMPSMVEGESIAPKFVVLSNALLVKQFGESVNLNSHASFAEYVLRTRNFTLPYRLINLRQLKKAGTTEATLNTLRDASSKPVLHYFPATNEAAERAQEQYSDKPALGDIFTDAATAFFFIERANPQRFEKIELPLDVSGFDATTLEDVAFKSATVQANARKDAKDMLLSLFNNSIEEMRRINLRYILLGRAFGQGFDVFNVTQVFNTEPAPDRATEVQRRGRFARPGSHAGLPYDRWLVQYRTLVARYLPEDEASIRSMSDLSDQLIDSEAVGAYAVVASIESDPVDEAQQQDILRLRDNIRLHPYQAVRIKIEDPSITLKRLQLEKVFDGWAIDSEHNRVIADSDERPVHSPTNYIISASFVTNHFKTMGAALPPLDIPDSTELQKQLTQQRSAEFAEAVSTGDLDKMTELQKEIQAEMAEITRSSADALAKRAEVQNRTDMFEAIEQDSIGSMLTIERRLARAEEKRELFVRFRDKLWSLDFSAFDPEAPAIAPTSLLRKLIRRGFAQFDPRFERPTVEILPDVPKRSDLEPGEEQATGPDPKKQKEDIIDAEMDLFELVSSSHSLPHVLVGASSDPEEASEFVSFGTIVEKTAFADQEQESIERDILRRFRKLAVSLDYWEDDIPQSKAAWPQGPYQKRANTIYEKIGGGSTTVRNPTALKNAILELHKYGIMNWNTALDQIAHAVHSEPDDNLPKKNRTGANETYLKTVAEDIGHLYVVAARKNNTASDLKRLVKAFGYSDLIKSPKNRSHLIALCYRVTASVRYEHTLQELAKFVRALRKRYRIVMKKDMAVSVLHHLAKTAGSFEQSEDPSTFALFRKLIQLKSVEVKGIHQDALLGYFQELLSQMVAPSGTLKATVADAVYARSNRKLQKLNELAAFLSDGEVETMFMRKVTTRTVVVSMHPIALEKNWPLVRYLRAIELHIGTTDETLLFDHLVEILSKVKTYDDQAVRERILSLKSNVRPTALLYQTGSEPARSYSVASNAGGQLYYEENDQHFGIPRDRYAELFRSGFETDAFPRLRFDADRYKNYKPDQVLISSVVDSLRDWARTQGLTDIFWTNIQEPATFQVIATASDDSVLTILERLDRPALTSELLVKLVRQKKQDLLLFLLYLDRIARNLQSVATATELLVRLEADGNPNYTNVEADSVALKFWKSYPEDFQNATAQLEVLANVLGKKSGDPMRKRAIDSARTLTSPDERSAFQALFDTIQAEQHQDFATEIAALDTPLQDVITIDTVRTPGSTNATCAACGSDPGEDAFACECETVLYCDRKCQSNDWSLHSKFCMAVRVTSSQQTETN